MKSKILYILALLSVGSAFAYYLLAEETDATTKPTLMCVWQVTESSSGVSVPEGREGTIDPNALIDSSIGFERQIQKVIQCRPPGAMVPSPSSEPDGSPASPSLLVGNTHEF